MGYGDDAGQAPMRFSLGSQGFHLLTPHLPKLRLASGIMLGRQMSPGAAWLWSKSNQVVSDAG
jgi:hypothetical protein